MPNEELSLNLNCKIFPSDLSYDFSSAEDQEYKF